MIRRMLKLTMCLAIPFFSQTSFGNEPCGCPPVPPSCSAPSCSAPCNIHQGCAEAHSCSGGNYQSSNGCANNSSKCCRPFIHIDLSKRIVKKNGRAGGFFGEAPPSGIVAPSMAVLPMNITTMPVSFGVNQQNDVASQALAAALVRQLAANNAQPPANNASAAAADSLECEDPCGQIKKVEMDIKELKEQMIMITELLKNSQG